MRVWRWIYVGALALCLFVGLGIAADDRDDPKTAKIAPRLKVDPSWPKPLPNNWVIVQVGGIAVDRATMSGFCSARAPCPSVISVRR